MAEVSHCQNSSKEEYVVLRRISLMGFCDCIKGALTTVHMPYTAVDVVHLA